MNNFRIFYYVSLGLMLGYMISTLYWQNLSNQYVITAEDSIRISRKAISQSKYFEDLNEIMKQEMEKQGKILNKCLIQNTRLREGK